MKSTFRQYLATAAVMLTAAIATTAIAAPPASPVLTNASGWDLLMTGKNKEQGIAFLTLNKDQTIDGAIVSAKVGFTKVDLRSGSGSGRGSDGGSQASVTNIFGYTRFANGWWNFDEKGYTVGFFTYNVIVGDSTNLNQVSFKAKIAQEKKFTASYSSSLGGNGVLRGVPIKPVTDLTGAWSASEKNGSLTTYEWFSLVPAVDIWPNLYVVADGYGPGYSLDGHCMVSCQKRIGFGHVKTSYSETETNYTTRGAVGSFINKSSLLGGKTKGLSTGGTNVVSYNAYWINALPVY